MTALAKRAALGREVRHFAVSQVELRAGKDGGKDSLSLAGYACVTDEPYTVNDMWGSFSEIVRAGAFQKSLVEQDDVRLLLNHDGMPLARTKSGTLTLTEKTADSETKGLFCEAELEPRSGLASDVALAMERGDLDEMSFAFTVTRQEWSPDYDQRDIHEVKLYDVSVVTYPANPATSVGLRAAAMQVAEPAVLARAMAELRTMTLSDESVAVLQQLLGTLGVADEIVDAAQEELAAVLSVPNPDPEVDEPAARAAFTAARQRLLIAAEAASL